MKNEKIRKMFDKKNWLVVKLGKIRFLKNQIKMQMIFNQGEKSFFASVKRKILFIFYVILMALQFMLQIRYYKIFQKINLRMISK